MRLRRFESFPRHHPSPRRALRATVDSSLLRFARKELERETGIEPATNSLEGCDSTTELLPQSKSAMCHPHFRDSPGGEGRIRTSEAARATDLQSAAFDRSATSPSPLLSLVVQPASGGSFATSPGGRVSCKLFELRCLSTLSLADLASGDAGAGGGIRTPDRLITNQLLYRTELRQPDKDTSLARPVPR